MNQDTLKYLAPVSFYLKEIYALCEILTVDFNSVKIILIRHQASTRHIHNYKIEKLPRKGNSKYYAFERTVN